MRPEALALELIVPSWGRESRVVDASFKPLVRLFTVIVARRADLPTDAR